jgi:NAD-dependent deacetylase
VNDSRELVEVSKALRAARHGVVFTGAGVSAESGIPTFRDALTGLWSKFDPHQLATVEAFERDPALVWAWYEWRRRKVAKAAPNAAHVAITQMFRHVPQLTVVTQNVDDLHERAGSRPIRLHGSLFRPRCFACGAGGEFGGAAAELPEGVERIDPPQCIRCGGLMRPGVVWFGEALPQEALDAALDAAKHCDVLLSVGTSSVVYPAAEIPQLAARAGAAVVQVNPDRTALDELATFNLRGSAATILPQLVREAWPETVAP